MTENFFIIYIIIHRKPKENNHPMLLALKTSHELAAAEAALQKCS